MKLVGEMVKGTSGKRDLITATIAVNERHVARTAPARRFSIPSVTVTASKYNPGLRRQYWGAM